MDIFSMKEACIMEYSYLDVIEFMDYPVNYEVGLAYYWLHPEYIPKKIITLGKFDYGFSRFISIGNRTPI